MLSIKTGEHAKYQSYQCFTESLSVCIFSITNITTPRTSTQDTRNLKLLWVLNDGEILAGNLPRKQLRLVQAWIELHRDELIADWELAVNGEEPYKITPL